MRWAWLGAVAAVFAVGTLVRLDGIGEPPLDASSYTSGAIVIRQYHSALLARAYFLDWRNRSKADRELAAGIEANEKLVEPPIVEGVTTALYLASGGERLWLGRLLSVFFWIVGGVCVVALGIRVGSEAGALVAASIYLLLPFSVVASRSFQPDPLLVAATLAAILLAVRFSERPTRGRLVAATAAAAFAALTKPGWALFVLVPLFASLQLRRTGTWAKQTLGYTVVAAAPALSWIVYGRFFATFLRGQTANKVQPSVLADPETWKGWLSMIGDVLDPLPRLTGHQPRTGFALIAIALLATAVARRSTWWILLPLWLGYFAFGATFATHTATHDYYSLMLIPIVALAAAAAVRRVPLLAVVVAAALIVSAAYLRHDLHRPAFGRTAAVYRAIGSMVTPGAAVALAPYYSEPLEYHGRIDARWWPTGDNVPASERRVTVAQRLSPTNDLYWPAPATMSPRPRYFVAEREQLRDEPDLRRYLRTRKRLATVAGYEIFDLTRAAS